MPREVTLSTSVSKLFSMQENTILEHLQRIERQLEIINTMLGNFMGFEELSEKKLKKLDEIEVKMERGEKFSLE